MAQHIQFKGIKRVLSSNTAYTQTDSFLYFVRESSQATSGDIWFMGHHYGHFGEHDLDAINTALEGFLTGQGETGYTNVKEYIDNAIAQVESNVTTVEKGENSFSGLTIAEDSSTVGKLDYTITLTNVAPADELADEISARTTADAAIQTELDAVEAAVGLSSDGTHVQSSGRFTSAATTVEAEIAALDAALQNVADQTIVESGSTENYVNLTVETDNTGKTTIAIDDSALKSAIEAMDLTEVHETGKAIVAVSEADGVVSATAGTIAAQYVDVADAGELFTATNVEGALAELYSGYTAGDVAIVGDATTSGNTLGKLEDRIEELSADAKEYHLVKVTTGLAADIKEEYYLADAEGHQSGDTISIPKDSHIVEINYITDSGDPHYQNLEYVYIDVCGATKTEYVDMSQLVLEQEFASGVQITNHVAHGVVDPQSEEFLTVGADGFKLSGVQDAIDEASTTAYTASTAYTDTRISALDYTDTAATGQYVTEVNEADGVISVSRANVSEAVLNNYVKGSDATAVAATDTVNEAISKLENQVDAAKAAATTKVEKDANANHLTLTSSTASDGSVTYTIGEDDIASQAELDAVESSLGFNGTAYTQSDKYYISGRTVSEDIHLLDAALDANNNAILALQEALDNEVTARTEAVNEEASARTAADEAIDERLDAIEEAYLTGLTVNGVVATVSANTADVTIEADDIELGTAITAETGSSITGFDADEKVDDVLQAIVDKLNEATAGSYSGVTSTGNTLAVTDSFNGNNIEFLKESATDTTVADGHLELAQNNSKEWYGVMYWIDEETE